MRNPHGCWISLAAGGALWLLIAITWPRSLLAVIAVAALLAGLSIPRRG